MSRWGSSFGSGDSFPTFFAHLSSVCSRYDSRLIILVTHFVDLVSPVFLLVRWIRICRAAKVKEETLQGLPVNQSSKPSSMPGVLPLVSTSPLATPRSAAVSARRKSSASGRLSQDVQRVRVSSEHGGDSGVSGGAVFSTADGRNMASEGSLFPTIASTGRSSHEDSRPMIVVPKEDASNQLFMK